jgi:hypothetical protein
MMNKTKQKSKVTATKSYEIEPIAENEVHKKGSKKSLVVRFIKIFTYYSGLVEP